MSVSSFAKQVTSATLLPALLAACALTLEPSRTPRTSTEQLLLSHAITRSVKHLAIPLPPHEPVVVEIAGFPNDRTVMQTHFLGAAGLRTPAEFPVIPGHASDLPVVQGKIEGRLGELGLTLSPQRTDAHYFLRVIVEALGTDQGESFIGMPPVQSVLLPFALPELTLFKAQRQRAYSRFTIDIYDARTGELIRSMPWHEGSAYYNQYTVLFFFTFEGTDLVGIP